MIERTIAKRYAIGLIENIRRLNLVRIIEEEIIIIAKLYETNKDLQNVLRHPRISQNRKIDFLNRLFKGKINEALINFLVYLIRKKRIDKLPLIAEMFDELADLYEGVVRVDVETAFSLSDVQKRRLEAVALKLTNSKIVDLRIKENRDLIGGFVLRFGDTLIDCSISGKLKKLREHLIRV